jgi:RimJ/RimL family protein N-acetyltransferase
VTGRRVRIVRLPLVTLEALRDGNRAEARATSPVPLSDYLLGPECRGTWTFRADQIPAHPEDAAWVTGVIWADDLGAAVGQAGFHAAPDRSGTVEVGYAVDPAYRRRGYARAALGALLGEAAADPGVRRVLASVAPDNAASLALIEQFGFARIGEQVDEIDGLEWVHAREVDHP